MRFYFVYISAFIIGCSPQSNSKDLDEKLNSLADENRQLNEKLRSLENEKQVPGETNVQTGTTLYSTPESNPLQDKTIEEKNIKYVFVLFEVEKREFDVEKMRRQNDEELRTMSQIPDKGYSNNIYNVVTKVMEMDKFNDEIKYMLMDDAQAKIKYSLGPEFTGVKSRKCFVYDSYKDASIARSAYITDKN